MQTKYSSFFPKKPSSDQEKQLLLKPWQPKLLCLKGQTGTVACRVHDPLAANILPSRSQPWNRLKYAWLSAEKMHNLTAVRGRPGASMVGPADYFCDLERSDQYLYTIEITPERLPRFIQHPHNDQNHTHPVSSKPLSNNLTTKVNAKWYSGFNKEVLRSKMTEYSKASAFGGNLFPNSGILEIDSSKEIILPAFDPKEIDLSSFKARLVPNHVPFQITAERLYVDDEFCAVSYQYDANYGAEQVQFAGGNFLEFHEFTQTITPLDVDTAGFVTLAKWNALHTQLELIAIQIPYGYTLIIEKNCIHGDTTLKGLFMMCMTSDHLSMATADTVFLKHAASKDNISLKLDKDYSIQNRQQQRPQRKMDPLVLYKENNSADFACFKTRTQDMDVIFTPTRGYWEIKKEAVGTIGFLVLSGACLLAAILLIQMTIPCLVMLSIAGALAGVGLFRATKKSNGPAENNLMPEQVAI